LTLCHAKVAGEIISVTPGEMLEGTRFPVHTGYFTTDFKW